MSTERGRASVARAVRADSPRAARRRLALAALGALAVLRAGATSAAAYDEFFEAIRQDDDRRVGTWLLRGVNPNTPEPTLGPPIVMAARLKAYRAIKALLASPETQVDATDARGETALMLVCAAGDVDAARMLIAKGAQVNRPGWTPLHYAASGGHLDMVKFLVEQHYAYIDAASPNDTTPLMMAARQRFPSIVQYLVGEGADPTVRNEAGLTAVDYLQYTGNAELAAWMREKAREFDAKYRGNTTR